MAALKRAAAVALAAALVLGVGPGMLACSSTGGRAPHLARRGGTTHVVRAGENLYRIGKRYGVPAEVIQEANDIRDVTALRVGQRLWIPPAGAMRTERAATALRERIRSDARSEAGVRFRWPVHGRLTSSYGSRRGAHEGIDIAAPRGTAVLAAEAGKVVFAGRMSDYGKMVIVKHTGNYRSIYAHVRRFHVRKGSFVESGQKIAEVGTTGNATGPHLHFEIRERDRPRNPMLYLP
jgi:murein DD-endopeptidase MepM/ murein hydrolase activator NlpD